MNSYTVEEKFPFGAIIHGVDIKSLSKYEIDSLMAKFLVIGFSNQQLTFSQYSNFAQTLGTLVEDNYHEGLADFPEIKPITRKKDEKAFVFASHWHSDFSFLDDPSTYTLLYGKTIPPNDGDTLFSSQYLVYDSLPEELKNCLETHKGIHSSARGYGINGVYGREDINKDRSIRIKVSKSAHKTVLHDLIQIHPGSKKNYVFSNFGYTIGVEGLDKNESEKILKNIFEIQQQPYNIYRHKWSTNMLTIWDNRCLTHAATGGYDGYDRICYRIVLR